MLVDGSYRFDFITLSGEWNIENRQSMRDVQLSSAFSKHSFNSFRSFGRFYVANCKVRKVSCALIDLLAVFRHELTIIYVHWYCVAYFNACDQLSSSLTSFLAWYKHRSGTVCNSISKQWIQINEQSCSLNISSKFTTYAYIAYWLPFTTSYLNYVLIILPFSRELPL